MGANFRVVDIRQELYSSTVLTVEGKNAFTFNSSILAEGIYFFNVERENTIICTMKVVK